MYVDSVFYAPSPLLLYSAGHRQEEPPYEPFYKAPRDIFDYNRHDINKDELNYCPSLVVV